MEVVNGYLCKDCTDVDYAKKHINPADPKAGPFNVDWSTDPQDIGKPNPNGKPNQTPAVTFGGQLAGATQSPTPSQTPYIPGSTVNVSA